jgi:hypothetical protein
VKLLGHVPGATALDTSPGLDGAWQDAYIDLIHLTQTGRDRLAEKLFEAIAPRLRDDPRLRCRPTARPTASRTPRG